MSQEITVNIFTKRITTENKYQSISQSKQLLFCETSIMYVLVCVSTCVYLMSSNLNMFNCTLEQLSNIKIYPSSRSLLILLLKKQLTREKLFSSHKIFQSNIIYFSHLILMDAKILRFLQIQLLIFYFFPRKW